MGIKKIKLRGGPLVDLNSITLSDREVGITTDTEEIHFGYNGANVNLSEKNRVYMPINYLRKQSALPLFTKISGAGSVAYDSSTSAMGTGCFLFTGDGEYLLNRFYAVSPIFGIGGHAAFRGIAVFGVGAKFYDANFVELSPTTAQRQFIVNGVVGGGSFVGSNNHLVSEGTGANQMPVNTRYIKPYISVSSNGAGCRLDAFVIYPNGFALRALYT